MWYTKYSENNIPFLAEGRSIEHGLDCWGLIYVVYKTELGINLPKYDVDYNLNNDIDITRLSDLIKADACQNNGWHQITDKNLAQPFDVWVIPLSGIYTHVALYTSKNYMLHIQEGCNVTHEACNSLLWKRRMSRALLFRHEEMLNV